MTRTKNLDVKDGFHPSDGFEYYSEDIYWNSFEAVQQHINFIISQDASVRWSDYLLKNYPKFENCLSLNCGNGWVEQELFQMGVSRHVAGFDFSQKLLDDAIKSAAEASVPATYWRADCNLVELGTAGYDLVVNHAAMHHVAFIDRLTRQVAASLTDDGKYVGFDYIGPHRNQYPSKMWAHALKINDELPHKFRNNIMYPHMKTMLSVDRTEAIHSELQVDILHRYFEIENLTPLGGCIAYLVLFNNKALYNHRHSVEGKDVIERVLDADRAFLLDNPGSSLFAFWVARPKRGEACPSAEMQLRWQAEEDERELTANAGDGRYYPPTDMERVYNDWELRVRSLRMLAEQTGSTSGAIAGHGAKSARRADAPPPGLIGSTDVEGEIAVENNVLHEQNLWLRLQLSEIRNSTSWRITAPLRALKSALDRRRS